MVLLCRGAISMANDLVERIKAIYAAARQQRRRDQTEPTPSPPAAEREPTEAGSATLPQWYDPHKWAGLVTMFLIGSVTMLAP
jgi:hypothetical protein